MISYVCRLATVMGFVVSVISVAKLVSVALTDGAEGVLALCFKWWDTVLHFLLGWTTPYLVSALTYLAHWVPIHIVLLEHWYHVLVLMGLYVTGDILVDWFRARIISALLTLLIGYPIAVGVSAIVGTVDLTGADRLAVIFAICGFAFYQLFRSVLNAVLFPHDDKGIWKTFLHFFRRMPLMDVACGVIALAVGKYATWNGAPLANLVVLLLFVVLIAALRNLLWPALFVISSKGRVGFWKNFVALATVKLGLRILAVIAAAIILVIGNAGV